MFDNGINQDTVLYVGFAGSCHWFTCSAVSELVNESGYALTNGQCSRLLESLLKRGKVEKAQVYLSDGSFEFIWKRQGCDGKS